MIQTNEGLPLYSLPLRDPSTRERPHASESEAEGRHRLDEKALDSILDGVDLRLHLAGLGGDNAAGDHGTVERKRSETVAEQVQ